MLRKYSFALCAILLCFVIFLPFFRSGHIPASTDLLTGFYHPWISVPFPNLTFPFPVKNFEAFDVVRQNYPWKFLAISQIKRGQLPLWNPTHLSGVPLLAEFISGSLYPLNLIFLVTSFITGWAITSILQVLLAFLGGYFLTRTLGISKLASLFAALTYSLSGFMSAFFGLNLLGHAYAWMPFVLAGVQYHFLTHNRKWLILSSLSLFLIGTSHLQILFYITPLTILFIFYTHHWHIRPALLPLATLLLGLLSTSYQVIPTLELLQHSPRLSNYSVQNDPILSPPFHPLLLLSPNYFGHPGKQNYFGAISYYHEFSFYIGASGILLVLLTLTHIRTSSHIRFWWLVLGMSLLLVIDSPLSRLPAKLNLPVLGSITPTRIYSVVDLALVLLASFGLDYLLKNKVRFSHFVLTLIPITGFGLLFTNILKPGLLFWRFLFDTSPLHTSIALRNTVFHFGLFTISLTLVLLLFYIKSKRSQIAITSLLLLMTLFDLSKQFSLQTAFVPPASIFPATKITTYLQTNQLPPRVLALEDRILPADIGAYYGWEHVDGYQADAISAYLTTLSRIDASTGNSPKHFAKIASLTSPTTPVISELGVDYFLTPYALPTSTSYKEIMTEGEVYLYQSASPTPRFSLPHTPGTATDLDYVTTTKALFGQTQVHVTSYQPNNISLTVSNSTTTQPLYTFIPYYPGWRAQVNGKPANISPNPNHFISLTIPSGTSTIQLSYLPTSFLLGLVLTTSAFIVIILSWPKRITSV